MFHVSEIAGNQVWQIDLDKVDELALRQIELTPEEALESKRFHDPQNRKRYELRHKILRHLLATHLNVPPKALKFKTDESGKPHLVSPDEVVFFNTSYADNMFMVAIGETPLGIDIEKISDEVDVESIGDKFFSKNESLFLKNHANTIAMFYRLWTAKEAYLKGTGENLLKLRETEISNFRNDMTIDNDWKIQTLPTPDGFASSVAWYQPVAEFNPLQGTF